MTRITLARQISFLRYNPSLVNLLLTFYFRPCDGRVFYTTPHSAGGADSLDSYIILVTPLSACGDDSLGSNIMLATPSYARGADSLSSIIPSIMLATLFSLTRLLLDQSNVSIDYADNLKQATLSPRKEAVLHVIMRARQRPHASFARVAGVASTVGATAGWSPHQQLEQLQQLKQLKS